jgi:NAD(P)-dependent dehydrogenase (short-subunit alcohol dehydrogenase family)
MQKYNLYIYLVLVLFSSFKAILSKIVKENGHLDILVNNAGIGPTDDIEKLISINLVSCNFLLKKLSKYILTQMKAIESLFY